MAKETQITATLVRGLSYAMLEDGKFVRFAKGEAKVVTAAQKARLEAEAFDDVTARDDDDNLFSERRAKFKFDT